MNKIAYLGGGSWGFCLADLLSKNGHNVTLWMRDQKVADRLNSGGDHPNLEGHHKPEKMVITTDMAEALDGADFLVEGVTSAGIRPVFTNVKELWKPRGPVVLTSKGIEQKTGLLLSDVVVDVLGEEHRQLVGCLSGPSHAEEVINAAPTSVVASAYDEAVVHQIQEAFNNSTFRVYPNTDITGVEFGGAMKNIIAIACGISDRLGFGDNTKSAIMTRGLHEIRKLAVTMGCRQETLNGLAGMGDLCATCLSIHSRNYRFGRLLADGLTIEEAKAKIGMAVEGAYSVVSAVELGKKHNVPLPISEAIYGILYGDITPKDAVRMLFNRAIKEEHL